MGHAVIFLITQAFLGVLYASLFEYLAHKFALHGLGVKKKSFYAGHWHQHHRNCRRHGFYDPDYERGFLAWNRHGKEFLSVGLILLAHTPMFWYLPAASITATLYSLAYLYLHRKMHLLPGWGHARFQHHYDHHMGQRQDQNWNVVLPIWDIVLGTRVKYTYDRNGKASKL